MLTPECKIVKRPAPTSHAKAKNSH